MLDGLVLFLLLLKVKQKQAFTGKFSLESIWSSPGTFKESY